MSNTLNFKETMSTPKFHACSEPDCRTLTANQFCKAHTEPEQPIETQAQIDEDQRFEEIKASELKSREWEVRADKLDQMRAELTELRGPDGRSSNHETPIFSNRFESELI